MREQVPADEAGDRAARPLPARRRAARLEREAVDPRRGRADGARASSRRLRSQTDTRSTSRRTASSPPRGRAARAPDRARARRERARAHAAGDARARVDVHRERTCALAVADDGPGIDASQATHVFDRFYRVDGAPGVGQRSRARDRARARAADGWDARARVGARVDDVRSHAPGRGGCDDGAGGCAVRSEVAVFT